MEREEVGKEGEWRWSVQKLYGGGSGGGGGGSREKEGVQRRLEQRWYHPFSNCREQRAPHSRRRTAACQK